MIADILKQRGAIGAAHAVKNVELMNLLQFDNARQVVAAVRKEREAGALICSDTANGYYLPATADEVRAFIRIQEKRIASHAKTIKAARKYIKDLKTDHESN